MEYITLRSKFEMMHVASYFCAIKCERCITRNLFARTLEYKSIKKMHH